MLIKNLSLLFLIALTAKTAIAVDLQDIHVIFSMEKPPYVLPKANSGIEVDIITEVLKDAGYKVIGDYQPPARAIQSFTAKKSDAVATAPPGMHGEASDPYITFHNYAWTLKEKKISIKKIEDLANYSVAAFQNAKLNLSPEFKKAVSGNSGYQEIDDQYRQVLLLLNERVNVVIAEERIFLFNLNRAEKEFFKGQVKPVSKHSLFLQTEYRLVFQDRAVRDKFNKSLKKLQASGAIQKIFERYE